MSPPEESLREDSRHQPALTVGEGRARAEKERGSRLRGRRANLKRSARARTQSVRPVTWPFQGGARAQPHTEGVSRGLPEEEEEEPRPG